MEFLVIAYSFLAFVFLYNKIFAITFDEDFAKAVGVNVNLYNLIICKF